MKNIILGLILLFSFGLHGQIEEKTIFSQPKEDSELMDLVKILFIPNRSFSLNFSEKHVKQSYLEIKNKKKYDKDYLNELLDNLRRDSLNPIYLTNVADYYDQTNQKKLARNYYSKAYKNLDSPFNILGTDMSKDSASYYSIRGILKSHLGDPSALSDFEKSTLMKPTDSISMSFYPFLLLAKNKFDEARSYAISTCNANSKCATAPYFLLVFMEIPAKLTKMIQDSTVTANRHKNYDEIFDYGLLDKYASECKGNQEIQNARLMADILGLIMRNFFYRTSDSKISTFKNFESDLLRDFETNMLQYNSYETNKLQEIIKKLSALEVEKKLNGYALNMCYGYVYFMLRDWEKAIAYFNKAIEVFPTEKKVKDFSSEECYGTLGFIYFHRSDSLNWRKTINKKIANEPEIENTLDDQMKLAFDYFTKGNIEKAEDYCIKVREINPDHFDALRLMAHIDFLKGSKLLSRFKIERAGRHIRNNDDLYNLVMQSTIYQIYDGDIKKARAYIEKAKQIPGRNNSNLCDKLLSKYCVD